MQHRAHHPWLGVLPPHSNDQPNRWIRIVFSKLSQNSYKSNIVYVGIVGWLGEGVGSERVGSAGWFGLGSKWLGSKWLWPELFGWLVSGLGQLGERFGVALCRSCKGGERPGPPCVLACVGRLCEVRSVSQLWGIGSLGR